MPTYKAPVEDVLFLLNDVFHLERYDNLPGFADASPDTVAAILGEFCCFLEDCRGRIRRRIGEARHVAVALHMEHVVEQELHVLDGRLVGRHLGLP